jgi:hypothetical protein
VKRFRLWRWILLSVGPVLLGGAVLLLPLHPAIELTRSPVPPGADSALIVAGERYRAGPVRRFLLGTHYRTLWTQPVKVEVLKLRDFMGGLVPVREGGGMETRSLHFISANGRHYIFRSIDKEMTRLLHYGLSRSLLAWTFQDQTSSAHPAGALVAAQLQAAVGLPATQPRLVVLPDDDRLAGFRARFAGLFGTLQEAPGDLIGGPGGDSAVRHSDEVLALLDGGTGHRVDARGFLTARLLDFFLNDWDRHGGQWRWLPQAEDWGTLWRPVPMDRDQAFAWYDGVVMDLARLRTSKLSKFGPEYPQLRGLIRNSGGLDDRLLAGLERPAWDSIAAFLSARLSDSLIDAAVRNMPEPWWRLSGPELAGILRQRRAGISRIGTEFYQWLARSPQIHVAGTGEIAHLVRHPDGSIELWQGDGDRPGPGSWFIRRFLPGETERLDLHLHGELSRVVATGSGPNAIAVHVFDEQGQEVALPKPEGP